MEVLYFIWTVISFVLGLAWSVVWLLLRDLLSTLAWIIVGVLLIFRVRYGSFRRAAAELLRYVRHGAMFGWQWMRGNKTALTGEAAPQVVTKYEKILPFGYVSLSSELNVALVLLFALLIILRGQP